MAKIVAFRRAGTHALASLLHRNLDTGLPSYEDLHYSHSRIPEGPFVHVHRPLLPVALSFWRMRERFGIARSVSFAELLREPMDNLPRAESAATLHNGALDMEVHRVQCELTMPNMWLRDTKRFAAEAAVNVKYSAVQEYPLLVVETVMHRLGLQRQSRFCLIHDRVGWWPKSEVHPAVTYLDLCLLDQVEGTLSNEEWYWNPVHVN